ncbi:hypothetical protein LTR27_004168 [Elasticomyces elasticus]|nr:hypothetical protein LTR27_004168 [Elasticomyces elasticus]
MATALVNTASQIVPIRKTLRSTGPTSQPENKDKCMPQKKVFAHKSLSPIPLQTQQDNSSSIVQYEQARSAGVVIKPFRIMDMPPELRLKTLSYLVEDKLTVFLRDQVTELPVLLSIPSPTIPSYHSQQRHRADGKVPQPREGDALLDQNFLAKNVQQLRDEYRLDRLLELRGVKRISLIRFRVFLDNARAALDSLAEWLRGAMPKDRSGNGPEVVIE